MDPISEDKGWELSPVPLLLGRCRVLLCAAVTVPRIVPAVFQHIVLWEKVKV